MIEFLQTVHETGFSGQFLQKVTQSQRMNVFKLMFNE